MVIYGVDITTPDEVVLPVDENGYLTSDYSIAYSIEAGDYTTSLAYMYIYEDDILLDYFPIDVGTDKTITLSRGIHFDFECQYDAQIVLNYGSPMEIRSDIITLYISSYFIERIDPDFPDLNLRWDDYYPALGNKKLVIRGEQMGEDEDALNTGTVKAEIVYPTSEMVISNKVKLKDEEVSFSDGKAVFTLEASEIAPPLNGDFTTGLNEIEIKFTIDDGSGTEESKRPVRFGVWNVKNNSNTNLLEVLNGEAVIVYDSDTENFNNDNRKGVTNSSVTDDSFKKVDFVQELLNQVIPRKRSVTDYNLIDEDGIYYNGTATAIGVFKEQFNVDNTSINYGKNSFQKLMKDYDLESEQSDWKYKIIDKETLVGQNHLTMDVLINTSANSNDTGLYELYDNVVKVFIDAMIAEAENYAGIGKGTLPTENWIARTGHAKEATEDLISHGAGMSYSKGGKDSVQEFNDDVVNCEAYSDEDIDALENDGIANNEYRGNVAATDCTIGSGEKDWAGSYQWQWDDQVPSVYPFNDQYWAGIDCAGLIQRIIGIGGNAISSANVNITIPSIPPKTNRLLAIEIPTDANVYNFRGTSTDEKEIVKLRKKLKKGDLIRNNNGGHIAMVYLKCTDTDYPERFFIIHAFGGNIDDNWSYTFPVDYDESGELIGQTVFGRKVLVSFPENAMSFLGTTAIYGRIYLWN